MTNQEAIEYMGNEISCIKTASKDLCNRECSKCDLVKEEAPLIKAYDMAIKALEKQIPKKPAFSHNFSDTVSGFICECGNRIKVKHDSGTMNNNNAPNYCSKCGQKLDWS